MGRPITRRDFVDGVAVGVGAAALGPWWSALGAQAAPYPPARTGLRGSHVGSFELFHALRDGTFWPSVGSPRPVDREYDLVVVGAGISGLAAAHYFRQANPSARVLVLDNHDDFGGHAKRNEFTADGRTMIGYGGTQSIDSPLPYSATAKALIADLGIDVSSWERVVDRKLYPSLGLRPGLFFDREHFGRDVLAVGSLRNVDDGYLDSMPLSDGAKADIRRLLTESFDPWPGVDSPEKKRRLARISYTDFLLQLWKVDPSVLHLFQTRTYGLFGAGVDAVPAQDAAALGLPGFQGMALDPGRGPGQNHDSIRSEEADSYYFHFPDGNASVARLLVRRLIPKAIPGATADDIVTARADYGALDNSRGAVRIRLDSTVVRVAHDGDHATARGARVAYVRHGRLEEVRARRVVLACWHAGIPLLCPELPAAQREALAFATKVPLVYTNVIIREWTAFQKLGVSSVTMPNAWHPGVTLDFPVSLGSYHHTTDPSKPVALHLTKAACQAGLPIREQHRAGRKELFTTSFAQIERSIRDQLGRALGPGGFDPARDILGITANRWPHGYAYQYNSLYDDFWFAGGETPCEIARRPFGRIAIANADAGAYSYTDAAIDHAHRAVNELARLG